MVRGGAHSGRNSRVRTPLGEAVEARDEDDPCPSYQGNILGTPLVEGPLGVY